jgi:hypothetical protein
MKHENPGCPLNSECSKESGKLISTWEKLLKSTNEKNQYKKISTFHKEHGLPIEFLTTQKSKIALDPVLWDSRCRLHNPKNPNNNILKGVKFLKNSPKSEHVIFTPITLYSGTEKVLYEVPYQDQPILIKNNKIIVLKDYDDYYYQLAIGPNGKFEVANLPHTLISKALSQKIKETKCPEEMKFNDNYFKKTYCQKILDLDTNSLKTIQYAWSCP